MFGGTATRRRTPQEDIVSKHRTRKDRSGKTVADLADLIGRPDLAPGSPARLGL